MKSPVVKRSVLLGDHKTSVSLEQAFWNCVKEISGKRGQSVSELVSEIDGNRQRGNLSSAIRLFVLDYFRTAAEGQGNAPKGNPPKGNAPKSTDAKAVDVRFA